ASANYYNVTLTAVDSANNAGSSRAIVAVGSWNPNVACVPSLTALSSILGSAYPSQSLAGSQWQTNSTAGGIPNKRALSSTCTLTNINGRSVPSYVDVDNVYLASTYTYSNDCTNRYDPVNGGGSYGGSTFCDSVGNIFSVDTTSGYLHIEFDQDWMAKGYCGPASNICNNSTIAQYASNGAVSLDVQGFVYWDPEAPNLSRLALVLVRLLLLLARLSRSRARLLEAFPRTHSSGASETEARHQGARRPMSTPRLAPIQ